MASLIHLSVSQRFADSSGVREYAFGVASAAMLIAISLVGAGILSWLYKTLRKKRLLGALIMVLMICVPVFLGVLGYMRERDYAWQTYAPRWLPVLDFVLPLWWFVTLSGLITILVMSLFIPSVDLVDMTPSATIARRLRRVIAEIVIFTLVGFAIWVFAPEYGTFQVWWDHNFSGFKWNPPRGAAALWDLAVHLSWIARAIGPTIGMVGILLVWHWRSFPLEHVLERREMKRLSRAVSDKKTST